MQECVAREAGLQYEHLVEHIGILAPAYDITSYADIYGEYRHHSALRDSPTENCSRNGGL